MSELLDGVVAAWDALPEDIAAEASLARLGLAIAAARAAAAAGAVGVPTEASWPGWVEPSMLWRHMDRAHGVPLLESEEADIRHAVSEEQERRIAALRNVLSLREGEIERWRASVCVLRAEMEHQALRASALEAVQEEVERMRETLRMAYRAALDANGPIAERRLSSAEQRELGRRLAGYWSDPKPNNPISNSGQETSK